MKLSKKKRNCALLHVKIYNIRIRMKGFQIKVQLRKAILCINVTKKTTKSTSRTYANISTTVYKRWMRLRNGFKKSLNSDLHMQIYMNKYE